MCVQEGGGKAHTRKKKSSTVSLLPVFAEVKPSCSTWVTPFIPPSVTCQGRMGQEWMSYGRPFKKEVGEGAGQEG